MSEEKTKLSNGGYVTGMVGLPNFGVTHPVGAKGSDFDVIYDESGFSIGAASKIKWEEPREKIISYKYAEGQIIADFKAYIDKTYDQHYQTENNVQCFDAWIALDDATPTFRNTALKYLWRYGKKNGNNKSDLMKALHYTLMCLYNDHYKDGK
jgi:hypothetical protein